MAYWYSVGRQSVHRNQGVTDMPDDSGAFSRFAAQSADRYEAKEVTHLHSVPDLYNDFLDPPPPTDYRVSWHIDISADTPQEAAWLAREQQKDANAWVGCFTVTDPDDVTTDVDLDQEGT